jgi:hypothetical protein
MRFPSDFYFLAEQGIKYTDEDTGQLNIDRLVSNLPPLKLRL